MTNNQHHKQAYSTPDMFARRATPLAIKLQEKIISAGPISVEEYVTACLRDPEYGYYIHNSAIGEAADFVTSPEISQIFGELIGIWCAIVWQQMGEPEKLNLLELGPGRGTLMADILRALAKLPKLFAGLHVHLLETNQVLKQQQEEVLKNNFERISHYVTPKSLCDVAIKTGVPWIVIGNEFLDALGVRQLMTHQGAMHERVVECRADDRLEFGIGKVIKDIDPNWPSAKNEADGQIFETMPALDEFVTPLLQNLTRAAPVVSLFIDYGHEQTTFAETLQAVHKHSYEHPLTSPGKADLSAHVNFLAAAQALRASGLTPQPLLSQAEFLGRLGIIERTSHLMAANTLRAVEIETATLRLIAPNGMGGRFKAIAGASPQLCPLPIF